MTENKTLDSAVQQFNKKNWEQAAKAFNELLADESVTNQIKHRIRQYQVIVDRKLNGSSADDEASDMKLVSYHMNMGERDRAREILNNSSSIDEGAKLTLLAEMAVEEEQLEEAVSLLEKAIEISTDNRGYALNSPVFAAVVNQPEFEFLRQGGEEQPQED
ncbi:hypothetical protein [Acanthopleuribacter pedis]|uniref:Tetratricopeptide repeat protein n=1 Tax=Acanthopleuribacter pedis TaxID=442870 RepID=A0A8J7U2S7_9BACT|nr:hypothetical protein [Acanthopleuribacter pedis]MBO1318044.1 hypothetical protein [Acanthopleuribacter pedis]